MRDSRLDLPDTKIQTMTWSFVSTIVDFEVPTNAGNLCTCLLSVRGSLLCEVSYLNFQPYLLYLQVCREWESIVCCFQKEKSDQKHVANGI